MAKHQGSNDNRRQNIRFSNPETCLAQIDLDPDNQEFTSCSTALVGDESINGVRLVFVNLQGLIPGRICALKVGNLPIFKAKIQWVQDVGYQTTIVGFQYLEESGMLSESSIPDS